MFCHKCGAQIAEGAVFCQKCGTKVVYEDTYTSASAIESKEISTSTAGAVQQLITTPIPQETPLNAPDNDGYIFKAFIDNHVRANTKYQSAEELLNSKVPQTSTRICLGIPAILFGILIVRAGSFSLPMLLCWIFLTLLFGYPAALLSDFIIGSRSAGGITRISEFIDSDDLIRFLNEKSSYLSPYFHTWSYITYTGFGVRGALIASTLNAGAGVRIGTGFGPKQRCFVEIFVEPDKASTDPGQMMYYFGTAMKSLWPSKYTCLVRTVPILQAAMEYYLKYGNNA